MPDDQTTFEHYISTNINAGWQKLEHYYRKLDDSPVYVAATVLHPRMKWRWLEKRWQKEHPDWIDTAKLELNKLSQRYRHRGSDAAACDDCCPFANRSDVPNPFCLGLHMHIVLSLQMRDSIAEPPASPSEPHHKSRRHARSLLSFARFSTK